MTKKKVVSKKLQSSRKWIKEKEYFDDYVDNVGIWNVNVSVIARHLESSKEYKAVPRPTVQRWKEDYVKKKGVKQMEALGTELDINSTVALKELLKMMKKVEDPATKINAIRTYFQGQKQYVELLESFAIKEKIADKLEHDLKRPVDIVFEGFGGDYPDVRKSKDLDEETKSDD